MARIRYSTMWWSWCVGGALLLGLWGSTAIHSADPPATKVEVKAPRLPNHFAKLSLSDDQREKIYATQMKYATEIEELKSRLKKLREDQQKEFESVLTPEQKSRLKLLKTESRKKSTSTATSNKSLP